MAVYIGLIHKDEDSSYGVSFPDLPGHITAGDTLDEAVFNAYELMALLRRHWREDTGEEMPQARSLSAVKASLQGSDLLDDAIFIAVSTDHDPFKLAAE